MKNILKKFGLIFSLVFVLSVGVFVSSKTAFAVDDITAPSLTTITHDDSAKTITLTWSEPIQLCNDVTDPCTESAVDAAHMKIYAVDGSGNWVESPEEASTEIDNSINTATFNGAGTILTITYTDLLLVGDYVVDSYGYDIIDMAGNRYAGGGVSPIFTVAPPYLDEVDYDDPAKTITLTFNEPIQFVDKITEEVVAGADIPAILNIFGFDEAGGWNVGGTDGTPSTIAPGVDITSAIFDADEDANSGTVLVITYTGNLEKTEATNYLLDYWVPGVAYGAGQDITDLAGNVIADVGDGEGDSTAPIFEVPAVAPYLATVAHNETRKTITFTFNEPVQFVTKDGDAPADPIVVIGEEDIPGILNIFVATWNEETSDWDFTLDPDTRAQDVEFTEANFNDDNTVLTVKYSGSLVEDTDYMVNYWEETPDSPDGYTITDIAGNDINAEAEDSVLPEFVADRAHSNSSGGSSHPTTPPTTELAGGCSGGNLFNTSTGAVCVNNAVIPQGCSGGNLFNTSTGAVCTNNAVLQIPGCGNSATGFSTATGGSCAGNHLTTLTTTYNLGTVTLKNGSKGEAVMELQRFLNAKLALGLVVDGKLGPKTIAVIKTWQKNNGLVSDGLVGPKTKAMMNK